MTKVWHVFSFLFCANPVMEGIVLLYDIFGHLTIFGISHATSDA